ncbi:Spx/MgsR family RNA polymerase-binding regulatory protein [Candidatus Phytoplasma pyri]|uniref:Spx/MgsR family RNA polymerase-binding regulatory protein n=1 Tax=Candidatus Phytoplasma pyri TaxID=47566 RepID=UPI0039835143
MIRIYTSLSSSSCKKAKNWLDEHKLDYKEFNLNFYKINYFDINFILKNTEHGFTNIISKRSNIYKEKKIDFENLNVIELKNIIIKYPSILRTPIIVCDKKIQVGYNSDDIRIFLSRDLKRYFMKNKNYNNFEEYQKLLKSYFYKKKK